MVSDSENELLAKTRCARSKYVRGGELFMAWSILLDSPRYK